MMPLTRSSLLLSICPSCLHQSLRSTRRRFISSFPKSSSSPSYEAAKSAFQKRNYTILNYTLSTLIGTLALSYGSVPLYKTVCQTMGWGGQPVKSKAHFGNNPTTDSSSDSSTSLANMRPDPNASPIRITFSSSVSSTLPWTFTPIQRAVHVRPGETALAFYTARNMSEHDDLIGVATYSVTPVNLAPYFSKIQCFCFEEQRLAAGECIDMPVFFYIDPAMLEDPAARKIRTVTLHYTFFKARYGKDEHMKPTSKQ